MKRYILKIKSLLGIEDIEVDVLVDESYQDILLVMYPDIEERKDIKCGSLTREQSKTELTIETD